MKRILALAFSALMLMGGTAFSQSLPAADASAAARVAEAWSPYGLRVVAETEGKLYFTTQGGPSGDEPAALRAASQAEERLLAEIFDGAVYVERDGAIYFLDGANSALLMALDPATDETRQVMDLGFQDAALTDAMDGLMGGGLIESGVYANRTLDAAAGALVPSDVDPTGLYRNFGGFETLLTASGDLRLRLAGSDAWQTIAAADIDAQASLGGRLYYSVRREYLENAYVEIHRFDPATGLGEAVTEADDIASGQMIAWGDDLALAGPGGVVTVNPEDGTQQVLFSSGQPLVDPSLLTAAGQLFLLARPDADAAPALVAQLPPSAVLPEPTPEPRRPLSRGDRGEDVRALQARLNALGYPAGREDGVFGVNTDAAVRYFQDALGLKQTGEVTEEMRQALDAPDAPAFVEFVALDKTSRGIRVKALQARLRELGYLAAPADGVYGSRTAEAVELFQKEAGLKQTGRASAAMIEALMDEDAPECSVYVTLKKGDAGDAVARLQSRLSALGYYAGSASGTFDDRTANAVKLFQSVIGAKQDGTASQRLQQRLFSARAPKYDGYITLQYGDSGPRVKALQARLKALGYFGGSTGGNFGSQTRSAVRAFQKVLDVKQTGTATVALQEARFADDAPTPTPRPTATPKPTPKPTAGTTPEPTTEPTPEPTTEPTTEPTIEPTPEPTTEPTTEPTIEPTTEPTTEPVPEGQVVDSAAVDALVDFINGQQPAPDPAYDRAGAVKWLQRKLMDMQYFDAAEGEPGGVYDQPTFDAVKKLQTDLGLSLKDDQYGLVGRKTFDAILAQGDAWRNPGEPIHRN
jgi:peptidoglycan hydrolase-like protein with peptidoglycan-binding domain